MSPSVRLTLSLLIAIIMLIAASMLIAEAPSQHAVAKSVATQDESTTLHFRGVDESWIELFEWAEKRYAAVDLQLPVAIVSVASDRQRCRGNTGLYVAGDIPSVRICTDAEPDSRIGRLIVLHELGHLWAENTLSVTDRARFLEVRGLASWMDSELPPHEWGAEHAAEVLSWGLMDELVRIIRIYNASPAELAQAFETLTGTAPLLRPPA